MLMVRAVHPASVSFSFSSGEGIGGVGAAVVWATGDGASVFFSPQAVSRAMAATATDKTQIFM